MKFCNECGTEKHEHEFSKCASRKDGLQVRCKACSSARAKRFREQNPEKCSAWNRQYYENNKDKISEKGKKHYALNKDKKAESVRAWRAANPDKVREIKKRGYGKNKEKSLAYSKQWQQENKQAIAAHSSKRRAIKRGAEGTHAAADVLRIFEAQRGMCATCETKLFKSGKKKFHVDHIMPLSKGGGNGPDNLQCLCPYCNQSKSDKTPEEWARINGKLI